MTREIGDERMSTADTWDTDQKRDPTNGRYITRYEWNERNSWEREVISEMKELLGKHDARIGRIETKWDKYTGPFIILLGLMGFIATTATIISAIYVGSQA